MSILECNVLEDPCSADTTEQITARQAVTQEMNRRGICRASELAKDLDLKETTVSNIMYGLYIRGYARRLGRGEYKLDRLPDNIPPSEGKVDHSRIKRSNGQTMPAKIISIIQQSPDDCMGFEAIKNLSGFSRQATGAVLSNLLNRGILARPQRGVYRIDRIPAPHGDRAEAVLQYLAANPWSRITEIQRGAERYIAADTIRKALARFIEEGKAKREEFFYALSDEDQTPSHRRFNREFVNLRDGRKDFDRVGRPPKTRRALLAVLKMFDQPRSAETLAKRMNLSIGATRSVLAQLVAEGHVVASKMRTDREDLRLVYHYQLANLDD